VCRARGMSIYSGQTCGEIMSIRGYHDWREDQYELFLGLVLFRLVTHPLQSRVVGPYLDAWFPNHLLLEGTDRIQIF
jgi:hypothetical protein